MFFDNDIINPFFAGNLPTEIETYKELCKSLDKIIEHSADGIFICDNNCIALGANRAYEIISGIPKTEIIGKEVAYLVKEYTTDAASLQVKETLKPQFSQYDFNKTGKKALVSSNPIFDDNGDLKMIVSTVRDITEIENLKNSLTHTENLAQKYKQEMRLVKSQLERNTDVIANDPKMVDVLYNANKIAKVNAPVLILGEVGVGKENLANYIYKQSNRCENPFVKVSCSNIPPQFLEAELFGIKKADSRSRKIGLFELANKGTVFLDEICDLPLEIQTMISNVLQTGTIVPVDSNTPITVDVRIIASTNRNLKQLVEQRLFRQDLFYRLNVLPINVPPLRERRNDIVPLVSYFLADANKTYQQNKSFSDGAYHLMVEYNWPGNVIEIKNVVERAVIMSDNDCITADDLSLTNLNRTSGDSFEVGMDLKEYLERIEFDYLNSTYEKFHSSRLAAKFLNMSKATFIRKRKQYSEKFSEPIIEE